MKGFSLIELLVSLAIIAILAASAFPLYTTHVLKTRRSEAKFTLLDLAARAENYYMLHHTYQNITLAELHFVSKEKTFYQFEIHATDKNYSLLAIPTGPQTNDQECGTFSYNQNGEKGISGLGNVESCW